MSLETIKKVICEFIKSDEPEVLALKGDWGVGKTHLWKKLLEDKKKEITFTKYSYISLFGMKSIDEVRNAIFMSQIPMHDSFDGGKVDLVTKKITKGVWKVFDLEKVLEEAPILKYLKKEGIGVGVTSLSKYLVKDSLICIDDIERIDSQNLKMEELLGLISELKTESNCKIVLIFNESKISNPDDYQKYREKVIDKELIFCPTPKESCRIGLPDNMCYRNHAEEFCCSLEITNIRVLQKVFNILELISPSIKSFHDDTIKDVIKIFVLLIWAFYHPDKGVIKFVLTNKAFKYNMDDKAPKLSKKQKSLKELLMKYNLYIRKYERIMYKVVKNGYLEGTGFNEAIKHADEKAETRRAREGFMEYEKLIYNTLSDNQSEIIAFLKKHFSNSIPHIYPVDINYVYLFLQHIGETELARAMLDEYISRRGNERWLFELDTTKRITTKPLRTKFDVILAEAHKEPSLLEIILSFGHGGIISREYATKLQNASESDLIDVFKNPQGNDLKKIIKACLMHNGEATNRALNSIASEGKLQAFRMKQFGIETQSQKDEETA